MEPCAELHISQNAEAIMRVLRHPSIWESIGGTEEEFELPLDKYHTYFVNNGAVFILHPEKGNWMIHANVIPEYRVHALEMVHEVFKYAFTILGAKKIVASIPEEYASVYGFALKSGMVEEEFINGSHEMALEFSQWVS